jgi:hypothetical protein
MSSETLADSANSGRPDRDRNLTRHARHPGSLAGGLVLIALGALFLLNNADAWHVPQSAWAIPLFIAAAGAAATAVGLARSSGSAATGGVVTAAGAAALLAFIGVVLLFDLNWRQLWPLFLIIPGTVVILGRRTNAA